MKLKNTVIRKEYYFIQKCLILSILIFLIIGGELSRGGEKKKYWIYFDKKENISLSKIGIKEAEVYLSKRALKRRLKVKKETNILDATDLPVKKDYTDRLSEMGIKIIHK